MSSNWGEDPSQTEPVFPFDGTQAEHVVPADGDPSAADYRAEVRRRERWTPVYRVWPRATAARRGALRRWLITAAIVALAVLFIKPLIVVAGVIAAILLGLVLFAVLATGALVLAARFALSGRFGYPGGRFDLLRFILNGGRFGAHWHE